MLFLYLLIYIYLLTYLKFGDVGTLFFLLYQNLATQMIFFFANVDVNTGIRIVLNLIGSSVVVKLPNLVKLSNFLYPEQVYTVRGELTSEFKCSV